MHTRLLLISPVRNEADHIEKVARAVAAQHRVPDLWIVIDDGSDDGTHEILTRLASEFAFLKVMSASELEAGDRLAAAAEARAFNTALSTVRWQDFTHVGKLDGDVELPPDWFSRLLAQFDRDPTLGMAGGALVEQFGESWNRIRIPSHHVQGAVKLYTRECFASVGGIQERLGWDTIDETTARMRGYSTRTFTDLVARHHRRWGSAGGTLRGRARHGEAAYILRYGVVWILLRSLKLATVRPYGLSGVAFMFGYARATAQRAPKVEDHEFKRYVRRELRGRIIHRLTLRRWTGSSDERLARA